MESITNPLYFFTGSSSTQNHSSTSSNVIRFIDILDFFFIAHPASGRKEGEEHKRIMYFHPKGESVDRQTEVTGFAEAVVNFTDNFLTSREINSHDSDNFDYRTVSTQKTEHVYIQIEDNNFLMGVALSKQLANVSEYPLFQPAIRSILCDAYKMFRMFFGTYSSFNHQENDSKFKDRLDFFFSRSVPLLKCHKMPLLDHLGGVEFLRMSGPLYLNVVSLINELQEEFQQIDKIMFLYQDKLLYYQLSRRDLPTIFRYLTQNLLPNSIGPELEGANNRAKGRYLRGPIELSTDEPLLGDESLPVVHLFDNQNGEDEYLQRYQMLVYRCLNSTVCMFVKYNTENTNVSRRLLRNIDQFLESELSQVANRIGEEIGSEVSEPTDFHYIYFNPSSLSMTSSLSSRSSSSSKVAIPPVEVNRLVCDTIGKFISDSEEFGECFVKSETDWWIVVKKVNSRLLVLIIPPSSSTSSLADIQSKTSHIVRHHFDAIFFT
ncbi:unnamed protein product [Caenorhabditis angaria]|uniref:CCZ1/INTU/HSP4 first Longin domain-containing protein n=1 Tax=Caenorhabditis angaria TaxID=860376 RepID=A0A9P1ITM8_9PELO|nr:unnamed protein product [Caenorhabditis angaria]